MSQHLSFTASDHVALNLGNKFEITVYFLQPYSAHSRGPTRDVSKSCMSLKDSYFSLGEPKVNVMNIDIDSSLSLSIPNIPSDLSKFLSSCFVMII